MTKRHLIFHMVQAVGIFAGFYFYYEIDYNFIGSESQSPIVQRFRKAKTAIRVYDFLQSKTAVRSVQLNRVYCWMGRERKRKMLIGRYNG